jgi:GAF domain-containing protein
MLTQRSGLVGASSSTRVAIWCPTSRSAQRSGMQMDSEHSADQVGAGSADPVQAFAELGKIVLGEPLDDTLRQVAVLAKQTIPGAQDVSVTLMENDKPRTVVFTGPLAVQLDERQYEAGFGPCLDAAVSGQTITVDNQQPAASAYPDFSAVARRAGIPHTLSVGLPVAQRVIGGLNIYGSDALPFDDAAVQVGETFASYAAVAIANAALYNSSADLARHMQIAMKSRAIIEQAKMEREHCDADQAFAILIRTSQTRNVKLRDIAATIATSTQREA